ncbi:DUF2530 domain-containing protein [Xylanimonas allomyrinae]|uniref:DUF2530 domain-containing protein n=1 Tax=Xylanimonas allomyrinae TaxID=2509459 RepID=A0A4P6EPB4_9MICO|nr:DUF2530 domain-containing protein [Xylanimonas allomyrinae]QAY63623.1 DUF2530 domain-containing protein [Xylanimonas allomyrinae]
MPSLVRLLTHPETRRPGPPPVSVDLRKVVLWGMAAWGVALVVTGILALTGTLRWTAAAVCASGLALGGLGLLWERRHR